MAPALNYFRQLYSFMECSHALEEGFLSVDECHIPDTSKHIGDLVVSPYEATYEYPDQPINIVCANCSKPIIERHYLLADGQFWHATCLRCALCGCDLQWQTSCFHHKGRLLCWQDYANCTTCPTCDRRFCEGDLVISFQMGLSFHVECLRCRTCEATFQIGDRCFVENGGRHGVSCLTCHHLKPRKTRSRPAFFQMTSNFTTSSSSSSTEVTGGEIQGKAKNRPISSASIASDNSQKRIRTSFKHDQLRLMKAYFRMNQNPDSKELRHLSAQTSLSKRVLQVWFQNARAKYRRWTTNLEVKANEVQTPETGDNQMPTDTSEDAATMEEPTQSCSFDSSFTHKTNIV
ncbi:LIM/homeobox protein Lhx9 [Echinococcus granulosus]|uniref:LIM:homeobox protein Lhx9 n=1 Tax=Echinococcus granulosus TaxID=6210 RepID=A0A068WU19_ECHGR|nr:LIM/homeobox protein Lhx9 [Echinococcus granulosus]CDS21125.1 LIM:homeobox protein Lhx9 [Echinococcus granulosus]